MNAIRRQISVILLLFLCHCSAKETQRPAEIPEFEKGKFGYDLQFLKKHHNDLVVLENGEAQLILLPAYQGRVMTSSATGAGGTSYGWINYDLISSGKAMPHMNAFGGEDRFWLGPEGGQFSIYFKKGVEFTFDNWFVPKELDTERFSLVSSSRTDAKFERDMHLTNYSGRDFHLKVNRNIKLLSPDSIKQVLGGELPGEIKVVGFESENIITNLGNEEWTKDSGALSIWILGMFNASDSARVVIPYKPGEEKEFGKIVTDDYFGKVPADRLVVKDGFMVFKADAKYRSKVGISPERALSWLCSYDPKNDLLTIVQLTPPDAGKGYVNSQWKLQTEPFKGDAVNSYNDGPVQDGTQMGNFYELESSSPAAFLKPGESMRHVQRTMHFQGSSGLLDELVQKKLNLRLKDISLQ
jgi:hypothetical protein